MFLFILLMYLLENVKLHTRPTLHFYWTILQEKMNLLAGGCFLIPSPSIHSKSFLWDQTLESICSFLSFIFSSYLVPTLSFETLPSVSIFKTLTGGQTSSVYAWSINQSWYIRLLSSLIFSSYRTTLVFFLNIFLKTFLQITNFWQGVNCSETDRKKIIIRK